MYYLISCFTISVRLSQTCQVSLTRSIHLKSNIDMFYIRLRTDSATNDAPLQQQNQPGVALNVITSQTKPNRRSRLSTR
jgi:hypothetical protein